jgi:hypothetical protein
MAPHKLKNMNGRHTTRRLSGCCFDSFIMRNGEMESSCFVALSSSLCPPLVRYYCGQWLWNLLPARPGEPRAEAFSRCRMGSFHRRVWHSSHMLYQRPADSSRLSRVAYSLENSRCNGISCPGHRYVSAKHISESQFIKIIEREDAPDCVRGDFIPPQIPLYKQRVGHMRMFNNNVPTYTMRVVPRARKLPTPWERVSHLRLIYMLTLTRPRLDSADICSS